MRTAIMLLLTALCAACSGGQYATRWDGRRGYDGSGDYGYDLAASNAEARSYRARAAGSYPVPGDSDDPWRPYIHEAADRFGVPEQWVREVMQQESGGRLYGDDGSLIISSAGAMGLMQVMPQTYDLLQQRYRLGSDPYEPRNNIMAGTAYIKEMYDRYGAPGFLAAYNAGPDRLDAYLTDGSPLPDETVNYVASVAPRLGDGVAMTGPLAGYAGQRGVTERDRAYAGGGLIVTRAVLSGAAHPIAVAATGGDWSIQVGAYADATKSSAALDLARANAGALLHTAQPTITPVQAGRMLYRARLRGLSATDASAACAHLSNDGLECIVLPPGS